MATGSTSNDGGTLFHRTANAKTEPATNLLMPLLTRDKGNVRSSIGHDLSLDECDFSLMTNTLRNNERTEHT
jgi:hypothetical protein